MARSKESNPYGKCTVEVSVLLDESTKVALAALAFAARR